MFIGSGFMHTHLVIFWLHSYFQNETDLDVWFENKVFYYQILKLLETGFKSA